MEFKVFKSGGLVRQFHPVTFTIGEDEFFYKKKKNDEKYQKYHISYLNEVYIQQQKEKTDYILVLEVNNKNMEKKKNNKKVKIIKLAMKDDKNTNILSDIKKILNVKRLQYDINLFLFNWKQKMIISVNKEGFNEFMDGKNISKIKKSLIGNIQLKSNIE